MERAWGVQAAAGGSLVACLPLPNAGPCLPAHMQHTEVHPTPRSLVRSFIHTPSKVHQAPVLSANTSRFVGNTPQTFCNHPEASPHGERNTCHLTARAHVKGLPSCACILPAICSNLLFHRPTYAVFLCSSSVTRTGAYSKRSLRSKCPSISLHMVKR